MLNLYCYYSWSLSKYNFESKIWEVLASVATSVDYCFTAHTFVDKHTDHFLTRFFDYFRTTRFQIIFVLYYFYKCINVFEVDIS